MSEHKSESLIAKENNVSNNSVQRILMMHYYKHKVDFTKLPETLCFDEFKSTKDCSYAMSFIYMDCKSGTIIEIVENRRLSYLENHFSRYNKYARDSVKFIVIDMY